MMNYEQMLRIGDGGLREHEKEIKLKKEKGGAEVVQRRESSRVGDWRALFWCCFGVPWKA